MNNGKNLTFLFGPSRSGTTWIGKVFDSHPTAIYRHEPDAVYPLADVPLLVDRSEYDRYTPSLQAYTARLRGMNHHRICGKLPLQPKAYAGALRRHLQWLSIVAARAAARASVTLPAYDPARHSYPDARVMWKSVSGLGRLGALLHSHPEAKAVLILRHPCGYVSSHFRGTVEKRFGGSGPRNGRKKMLPVPLRPMAEQEYGLTNEEYGDLRREETLTWRWLLFQEWARRQTEHLPNCKVVWYDDLCRDPVTGFKELFAFAELEWTSHTEGFLRKTVSSQRDHYYSVFKDPLVAAMRWQEELPPDVIDRILAVARRSSAVAAWLDKQPPALHFRPTDDHTPAVGDTLRDAT